MKQPSNVCVSIQPTQISLHTRQDAQVCYVLISLAVADIPTVSQPVNWALVADTSVSMRIPILQEDQFRQLVQEHGAQEVLVDGVPVWQLKSPVPSHMRDEAPDAMGHVVRALHSVVEQLDSNDRFTLVACGERAKVLVPNTPGSERVRLVEGINVLKEVFLGKETNLGQGLQLGLKELIHSDKVGMIQRMLLLTDGFTQDTEVCQRLAHEAASLGVAISTIGLGTDFQETLLTTISDVSGGNALFLHGADAVPQAIARELDAVRDIAERDLFLTVQLSQNVAVRRVTRVVPSLTSLDPGEVHQGNFTLSLGDLERDTPVKILLELLAPPLLLKEMEAERRLRLAQLCVTTHRLPTREHPAFAGDLVATYARIPKPLPKEVVDAAARVNVASLHAKALAIAEAGDTKQASTMLQSAARRLIDLGEHELAMIAIQEAKVLEQTGKTSKLGAKELMYATRKLGNREQ